jgi:hypothetical protein
MRNKLSKNSGRNTFLGRQKTQCPCALTRVAAARSKAKKICGLFVGGQMDWYPNKHFHYLSNRLPDSTTNEITNSVSNYKEQRRRSEANSFLASQAIPHILWNTKAHYCVHKSPPPVLILSHINPLPPTKKAKVPALGA